MRPGLGGDLLSLPERTGRGKTGVRRRATCHPAKETQARGLCSSCYHLLWRRSKGVKGRPGGKVSVVENFFDTIDNFEKAYVLGFILADGHVNVAGNMWSITNVDKNAIDYLHSLVGGRVYLTKKSKNSHKQAYQLAVCRKRQALQLEALGLKNDKSYTAAWPKVSPELEPDLLRGYLDGDGYLSKTLQRVSAVSASKLLMMGFAEAVGRIVGRVPKVTPVKTSIGKLGVNFVVMLTQQDEVRTLLGKVYTSGWGAKTKRALEMVSRPRGKSGPKQEAL